MPKITLMGAGSLWVAKGILGDSMLTPALQDSEMALYDIDPGRLRDSKMVLENLNRNINGRRAKIKAYLGVRQRKEALRGADYVVNSIQVGGYEPCTVIDFEVPKKYGIRQTIGDTGGIGGIFRALRTLPVMIDFARDIEKVCPDAWFLNYTNPMAMVTGGLLRGSNVKTVGLCHSVQGCASSLLEHLGMDKEPGKVRSKIAGINHMAWLLEIERDGKDLYPEIRKRAAKMNREARRKGAKKHYNMVRYEMMRHFGYHVTESSEHMSEYTPHWIKIRYPELIEEFNIPLDEYPRRCIWSIKDWERVRKEVVQNKKLHHERTIEYGSRIMEAMETNTPIQIGGNVLNTGLITNLPSKAVVEIPCLVDRNGVQGTYVGDLPEQCAALNMMQINLQLLTMEAFFTGKKDYVHQAAMVDPFTGSELSLDEIRSLCDDLIKAHGKWLPKFK